MYHDAYLAELGAPSYVMNIEIGESFSESRMDRLSELSKGRSLRAKL